MVSGPPASSSPKRSETPADIVRRGRPLPTGAGEAMVLMLGQPVGREGLAKVFQPGFVGIRTFVIQARMAPDQSVDLSFVGIARDGAPVWIADRAFARGRDGSIEIHHTRDDVAPEYRSRNILGETMRREVDLLQSIDAGPNARVTVDADNVGNLVCALHGMVFADETEAGSGVRSVRALEPDGDRPRMIAAAKKICERIGDRNNASSDAIDAAIDQLEHARTPSDILQVNLQGIEFEMPDSERDFATGFGRTLMLDQHCPGWRAALPIADRLPEGDAYRLRHAQAAQTRAAAEVQKALDELDNKQRAVQIRGLRTLGRIGPSWTLPRIRELTEDQHRGVAAIARETVRLIGGGKLSERIVGYATNRDHEPQRRALAYRVLTEHFPGVVADQVPMLRVDPDARIQRAAIPCLLDDVVDAGPALGSLLAANPWRDVPREGLLELRLEVIEHLARIGDSTALPPLMGALNAYPSPPAPEVLALSRALVSHPDPRARRALTAASERLDRPPVP